MTELIGYFDGSLPEGHRFERITAVPARGYKPALWMLGSSTYGASRGRGARAAVLVRLPLRPGDARRRARGATAARSGPSAELDAPYVMLGVSASAARATSTRAGWRSRVSSPSSGSARVAPTSTRHPTRRRSTTSRRIERQFVDDWTRSHVIGDVATVRAGLESLVERTGVDELMVSTMAPTHDDRVASYARLADAFALSATR